MKVQVQAFERTLFKAFVACFCEEMASQAVNVLLELLLTFKHEALGEEKEWRIPTTGCDRLDATVLDYLRTHSHTWG